MDDTFKLNFHHPFHELWTKTVGAPNYNKKAWGELHVRLSDAWNQRNNAKAKQVLKEAADLHLEQMA